MLTLSRTLLVNSAGSTEAARDQLRKRAARLRGAQVRHVGDGWGRLCGWRWRYECAGWWCRRLWLSGEQLTLPCLCLPNCYCPSKYTSQCTYGGFLFTYYISFSLCFFMIGTAKPALRQEGLAAFCTAHS